MPPGDRVGEAHVDIHVNAAPGEAELAAFRSKVDRDFAEIGRKKAEAEVKLKTADFDRKYNDAKKKLDYFKMRRERATLDLAKKHFDEQIAAAAAELKALGDKRTEIRIDAKQVQAASAAERLLSKEHALSERAALKQAAAEDKNAESLLKARREIDKLRESYNRLGSERRRLETKTGRPGGIFRTEGENLALAKVRSEMELTEHRIRALGGDFNDIDVDIEDNRSILLRWGESLSNMRVHMGFFSASIRQVMVGLVVLGPVLTGLVGAATSLVGVLGTGLAGASVAAAAGLSGLALSAIGAVGVIKPIVGEIQEVMKLSDAYHKAVLKYGKGSEEAKGYQEKLAQGLKMVAPGARDALEELIKVKEEFRELTQPARHSVFDALGSSVKTLHALLPSFARETNKTTTVLSEGWQKWMKELRSDDAKHGIETIMRNFRAGLPPLLNGFESLGRIFGRLSVSASKFLPGLNHGFAEWAENLERSVGSGKKLDSGVARLINHMRDFGHLSEATARLLVALFNTSANSGDGLLETLTRIFNRWADWMNSVEGQQSLKRFFSDSKSESENLFAVLGKIVELIWAMGRAFAPVSEGALSALNLIGGIVQMAAKFDPLLTVLQEVGKLMAAMWAIGRVQAFAGAVRDATRVLAAYAGVSSTAGATSAMGAGGVAGTTARRGEKVISAGEGAIAGTAAAEGAAAGRGLVGGLSKAVKIAGPAAMLLAGIELGESVMDAFADRAKQRSSDIFEALEGAESTPGILGGIPIGKDSLLNKIIPDGEAEAAKNVKAQLTQIAEERTRISGQTEKSLRLQLRELDISEDAKRSAKEMFALTRLGRKLDIKVSGGNDPAQLQKLVHGYSLLRSGALASLGDIGKVTQQNAAIIRKELPRGSDEARKKTAENFRLAAAAIDKAMLNGTISVKDGVKKVNELMRNAKLAEGRDPLGIAKGFANSWREAGGINRKNRDRMIDDLRKMPPKAREQAFQAMLKYGRGLVQGKKIPEEDLRLFKSKALAELTGIGGGFGGLSDITYNALKAIGENLSDMLKNIGGKPPKFNLKRALNMLPELEPMPGVKGGGQQEGGFTVPGTGSGDKVPAALREGSFVLNREATAGVYGYKGGGRVATMLEPGERVFTPEEVNRIGPGNLVAMNKAIPRQKGGPIGHMGGGLAGEPQIVGPGGALLEIGQGAVKQAYTAAEAFYKKQQAKLAPKGGAGYTGPAFGPAGTSMYKGIIMATWVRQALEYAAAHGSGDPQPTSGYRSHAYNVSQGRTYFSEHEKTQYPGGAVDFGGYHDHYAEKMAVVNATRGFKYPLLAPIGFTDDGHASGTGHMLGGFISAMLASGGFAGNGYTVKGVPASGTQLHVAAEIQEAGDKTGANHLARVASMMAATQENDMGPSNTFQLTGPFEGVTPSSSTYEQAVQWFTKGYYDGPKLGSGGGIEKSHKSNNPGLIAQEVEGSAYPGLYAQWKSEGQKWTDGWTGDGSGATGSSGSKGPPPIPDKVKADYTSYRVTPGGDFFGVQHKDVPVQVVLPDFGALPDGEENIKRELRKMEKEYLPMYRAAYRETKRKDVKAKLKESLAKIEKRIRELRAKLRDERAKKVRKKFTKKLQGQLGRITGNEALIEAAQHDYEESNQYAEQTVAFEPEQKGEITHDWLEKEFEPYIEHVERPAYEGVLGSENKWRNQILGAQEEARQIEKLWEIQIGWPQDGRKPWLENPDLHYPPRPKDGATGLADWIYKLYDSEQRIRDFAHSHTPEWWNAHPNAKKRRDQELQEIKDYFEPAMEKAKFERKGLTGVLGEGRESFNWAKGTGSFEDALQEVQGIHWPDQHEKLESLPSEPSPGMYGGAIWETQETIRGLGIKINDAKTQLEEATGDTGSDKAAEIASFEEAIRGLMAGRPFLIDTHRGPQPYMGAYEQGGVALVGERGPELAHLPSGSHIYSTPETERMLKPNVVVDLPQMATAARMARQAPQEGSRGEERPAIVNNVTNNFSAPPPDPHTWAKQQQYELGTLA